MAKINYWVVGIFLFTASLAQAKELILECGPTQIPLAINFETRSATTGFGVSGTLGDNGASGLYNNYFIEGEYNQGSSMELDFKTPVAIDLKNLNPGAHILIQVAVWQCQDDSYESGCSPAQGGGSLDCSVISNQ